MRPAALLAAAARSGYVKRCERRECAYMVGKALELLTEGEGLMYASLTR